MDSRPYIIPSTVIVQTVDDETLLFDSSTELFFALNEAGAMFWEVIKSHDQLQAVLDELFEMYDVDKTQLEDDLLMFVQGMTEQKLILFRE